MKAILVFMGLSISLIACKKAEEQQPVVLDGQWQLKESVRTDQQTGTGGPAVITPSYEHRLVVKGDSVRMYYTLGNGSSTLLLRRGSEIQYPRGGGVHSTIKELEAHRLVLYHTAPYQAPGMVGMQDINDVYTR